MSGTGLGLAPRPLTGLLGSEHIPMSAVKSSVQKTGITNKHNHRRHIKIAPQFFQ
jgi:hypothetical protein